jgi:hypothetical protein
MTENSVSPYVCRGCESVLKNTYCNEDKLMSLRRALCA